MKNEEKMCSTEDLCCQYLISKNIRKVTLAMAVGHSLAGKRVPKPRNKPNNQNRACNKENSCVQAVLYICFPRVGVGSSRWEFWESAKSSERCWLIVFHEPIRASEQLDSMVWPCQKLWLWLSFRPDSHLPVALVHKRFPNCHMAASIGLLPGQVTCPFLREETFNFLVHWHTCNCGKVLSVEFCLLM